MNTKQVDTAQGRNFYQSTSSRSHTNRRCYISKTIFLPLNSGSPFLQPKRILLEKKIALVYNIGKGGKPA